MPYFNQLYGEKHSGMLMLAKIYYLLFKDETSYKSETNLTQNKITVLYLAYNITSSGARKRSLISRVLSVTELAEVVQISPSLLKSKAQCMVDKLKALENTNPLTLS